MKREKYTWGEVGVSVYLNLRLWGKLAPKVNMSCYYEGARSNSQENTLRY